MAALAAPAGKVTAVGGVFFLGGTHYFTGESLHDVALHRWGVGWTLLGTDIYEHARTATFVPSDGKLWIVDDHDGSAAEILRVDPFTAERTSHGLWLLDGAKWDRHSLAVDADGTALLTSSSRALGRSRVARVRIGDDGNAYAVQIDGDGLPYTSDLPIVDRDEYGFIVRNDEGAITSIYRRASLFGATGSFSLESMFQ